MMYGYGTGAWWMAIMPFVWIGLLALAVWAVVRLFQPRGTTAVSGQPTAREILDRRYTAGEIDDATYTAMRARLTDPGSSA